MSLKVLDIGKTCIPFTNDPYICCIRNICLEIATKLMIEMTTTTQYYVKFCNSKMPLVKVHSDDKSHKREQRKM